MCEPTASAVHAVRLSQMRLGDTVVVLGAGPIGLLCMQAARAAGASKVIVSEPALVRAEAARKLGAYAVVNPIEEDAVERVVELTDGRGPDVVFECAGAKGTLDQALNMVRRNGQVVLVAIVWEETGVLPPDWMGREVNLQTVFGLRPEDWRISLELMQSGQVRWTASRMRRRRASLPRPRYTRCACRWCRRRASCRWTRYRDCSRRSATRRTRSRWW